MIAIHRRVLVAILLLLALGVAGCCLAHRSHGPNACGQPCRMKVEDCQKCAPNCQMQCPDCPCKTPAAEASPAK